MPNFLVEEVSVGECGETGAIGMGDSPLNDLQLILEITHVKQQQDLDVEILASEDGVNWSKRPVASFLQKSCCGTYKATVAHLDAPFVKAVWRVNRWGARAGNPMVGFRLQADSVRARAMAGAA